MHVIITPPSPIPRRIPSEMPQRPAAESVAFSRRATRPPSQIQAELPLIGSESGTALKKRVEMVGGTAADSQPKAARQHCFPRQALLAGSYRSTLADRMFTCAVTTSPYPILCVNHNITKSRLRSLPPTTHTPTHTPALGPARFANMIQNKPDPNERKPKAHC